MYVVNKTLKKLLDIIQVIFLITLNQDGSVDGACPSNVDSVFQQCLVVLNPATGLALKRACDLLHGELLWYHSIAEQRFISSVLEDGYGITNEWLITGYIIHDYSQAVWIDGRTFDHGEFNMINFDSGKCHLCQLSDELKFVCCDAAELTYLSVCKVIESDWTDVTTARRNNLCSNGKAMCPYSSPSYTTQVLSDEPPATSEYTINSLPVTPHTTYKPCPRNLNSRDGYCYVIHNAKQYQFEASPVCSSFGGHVAWLRDQEEFIWLKKLMRRQYSIPCYYLGLSRSTYTLMNRTVLESRNIPNISHSLESFVNELLDGLRLSYLVSFCASNSRVKCDSREYVVCKVHSTELVEDYDYGLHRSPTSSNYQAVHDPADCRGTATVTVDCAPLYTSNIQLSAELYRPDCSENEIEIVWNIYRW